MIFLLTMGFVSGFSMLLAHPMMWQMLYREVISCVPYACNHLSSFELLSHLFVLIVINHHQCFDPLDRRWGQLRVRMSDPPSSRQPVRQPWALERLVRERAEALSRSLDISSRHTYASALNSWLAFINMHHFEIEPTPDTLSYFIVYMSHHISPRSVKSYLSGLVQQLVDWPRSGSEHSEQCSNPNPNTMFEVRFS